MCLTINNYYDLQLSLRRFLRQVVQESTIIQSFALTK